VKGVAPPGTIRVSVTDDRGVEHEATLEGDTWSVGFDSVIALVRCTDAGGELIPRPLPEGLHDRVEDAPEACPVCNAVAWLQIGDWVACVRCGHRAGIAIEREHGVYFRVGEFEDADEPEGLSLDFDERWEQQLAEHLAAIDHPVYAVPGHLVSVGPETKTEMFAQHEYDGSYGDDTSELWVVTAPLGASRSESPRDDLTSFVEPSGDWHYRSLGGQLVGYAHGHRQARRLATRAEVLTRDLAIDGQPQPFELIAVGDAWVATREHNDVHIKVSAVHVDPDAITLEPIEDLPRTARDLRNRS
jgi:hypothetical protein